MRQALRQRGQNLFRPPYAWLPWALWLYVAGISVIMRGGGVYSGHILDFDSHARMVQVLNWINNPDGMVGGWYDRTFTRVNAPEGFTTIWSRLVDLPLAAIVIMAQKFMAQKTAALVACAVVPMIELAILFRVMSYAARPLVGKGNANLAAGFVFFTSILNPQFFSASGFFIGQASHHPWYIILNVAMFGAAMRLVMGAKGVAPVLAMGGSIALMTAVGIEGFPLIAATLAILALVAWGFARPQVALRGSAAALCGAAGSFVLVPIQQPPATFFHVSFAEPSILGAILVGAGALYLRVAYETLRRLPRRKIAGGLVLLCVAVLFAATLMVVFPQMRGGAAAGLSPAERAMAFHEHMEAKPVYKVAGSSANLIGLLMPSVLALGAGLYAIVTARGPRRRAVYLCAFAFTAVATGLSELYSRYIHHAMTTACLWLTWAWGRIRRALPHDDYRGLWIAVSFMALGPFWMLLLPAIASNARITTQILLFPIRLQISSEPCDPLPMVRFIDAHYPPETSLLVPYWLSAEFLYYSDLHIDFLALYPSQDKFIDNYAFFGAANPETSRDVAARHKVDLVAVCKYPSWFNAARAADKQLFIARIQAGIVPLWLKQVPGTEASNYRLYAVDHNLVNKAENHEDR